MYYIITWRFPIWFLLMLFCVNRCVFLLTDLLWALLILLSYCLFMRLFCYVSGCHILVKKVFGFSCIRLLLCFRVISSHLLVEFFSLFWNVLFCLYCFTLCRYLFNISSFVTTFWFISASCTVIFLVLPYPFFYMIRRFSLCFIVLACFRWLFICVPVEFPNLVLFFLCDFWGDSNFFTN